MQRQPDPLPDPKDRATWSRLLAEFEAEGPPPDWTIHRPGTGTFRIGLGVFGSLTLLLAWASLTSPESGRFDCALVGAILCGLLATFCLVSWRRARQAFVVLSPHGLHVAPLVRHPKRLEWNRIDSVDLVVHQNPRQTRDTYATLEIVHRTLEETTETLRIDGYGTNHLRVIQEQMGRYRIVG